MLHQPFTGEKSSPCFGGLQARRPNTASQHCFSDIQTLFVEVGNDTLRRCQIGGKIEH